MNDIESTNNSVTLITIFIDLRGNSIFSELADENTAKKFIEGFYKTVTKCFNQSYLKRKFLGDGFLVTSEVPTDLNIGQIEKRCEDLLATTFILIKSYAKFKKNFNCDVSVKNVLPGIAIGMDYCPNIHKLSSVEDYYGYALNRASRLQPLLGGEIGIVLSEPFRTHLPNVIQSSEDFVTLQINSTSYNFRIARKVPFKGIRIPETVYYYPPDTAPIYLHRVYRHTFERESSVLIDKANNWLADPLEIYKKICANPSMIKNIYLAGDFNGWLRYPKIVLSFHKSPSYCFKEQDNKYRLTVDFNQVGIYKYRLLIETDNGVAWLSDPTHDLLRLTEFGTSCNSCIPINPEIGERELKVVPHTIKFNLAQTKANISAPALKTRCASLNPNKKSLRRLQDEENLMKNLESNEIKSVYIAGTFNGWLLQLLKLRKNTPEIEDMRRDDLYEKILEKYKLRKINEQYEISLRLYSPALYKYRFILELHNGKKFWCTDLKDIDRLKLDPHRGYVDACIEI
jgi:class 3 adenylate cyclase